MADAVEGGGGSYHSRECWRGMVPQSKEVEEGAKEGGEGDKVEARELVVWFLGYAILD